MASPRPKFLPSGRAGDGGPDIGFSPLRLFSAVACLAVSGWLLLAYYAPASV